MAQIGLADTLKLLAAGYKKKDIDALASIDETPIEQGQDLVTTPTAQPSEDPAPAPEANEDLKKELEAKQQEMNELLEKLKENEDKIKKLQQDNVHGNSAPAAAEAKEKQQASLNDLVRSFM